MRSATATCLTASTWPSSVALPLTASTSVMTPSSRKAWTSAGCAMIDCSTGAGSASPVVSMMTRASAGDAAGLQPVDEIGQRVDQFAAHRAAEAAVGKLDDAVGGLLDQQMVDRHVAELVDDDRRVGERRVLQQPVEQRRLAGAEKAGQHRDGYRKAAIGLVRGLDRLVALRRGCRPPPARSPSAAACRAARSGAARRHSPGRPGRASPSAPARWRRQGRRRPASARGRAFPDRAISARPCAACRRRCLGLLLAAPSSCRSRHACRWPTSVSP